MPDDIGQVTSGHIRAFLVAERERTWPAFARHHRSLHVCFRWIETEGSGWNPTHGQGGEPSVPEVVKPFFTEAEITALLLLAIPGLPPPRRGRASSRTSKSAS